MKSILLVVLLLLSTSVFGEEYNQAQLKVLLTDKIAMSKAIAGAPIVVEAVKAQNEQKMTLKVIKDQDKAWIAKQSALRDQLSTNAIARFFKRKIERSGGTYSEMFVTDNQGANVACFPTTSDYWQGDEDKFSMAFVGKTGEVL